MGEEKKGFKLPHIYVLLVSIILLCAAASWVLPAGEFERVKNAAGRTVVVSGSYHVIESTPVGLFAAIKAVYAGLVDAADVVFFIFVSYASISILIATGAFNGLISALLKKLKGKSRVLIIPLFIVIMGAAASTIGVFEEVLPFIPIFVGISIAMGYDAIVGMAIIGLGVGLGYSGAAMNPFTVGIAQNIAELPPMSGAAYRIFCHAAMIAVSSAYTVRYALKVQADPTKSLVYGEDFSKLAMSEDALSKSPFGVREKLVLSIFGVALIVIVYGCKVWGWYFEEICATFLIMAFLSALVMGWGPNILATKIVTGLNDIAMACMMVGIARGILVVLRQGHIIDTIVYNMSLPLDGLPVWLAGEAMLILQTLLNFLIPSGSGQAATSMPIMTPLSDILGISRQVAVLAFQFGDGISNILWPTAFAPVVAGLAGVKLGTWWKWFVPLFGWILVTQMALVAIGIYIGW
ncbi:C4-dicarboxylate ABC transporter [Synergistales bacterium]|nr:C4-dicarboxylate ABC transporter [Synergistales bacterium]